MHWNFVMRLENTIKTSVFLILAPRVLGAVMVKLKNEAKR